MSNANFDPRDRLAEIGGPDRIRLMARSGGYVMCRRPRCIPFVLSEKEWARLPLYTADALEQKTQSHDR